MATEKFQMSINNTHVTGWLNEQAGKTGATWQGIIRQILYEKMRADREKKGLADKVWIHEKESV